MEVFLNDKPPEMEPSHGFSNSVFLTCSCGSHERRNAQKGRRTLDEGGVVSQLDVIVLLWYRFRAAKEGS